MLPSWDNVSCGNCKAPASCPDRLCLQTEWLWGQVTVTSSSRPQPFWEGPGFLDRGKSLTQSVLRRKDKSVHWVTGLVRAGSAGSGPSALSGWQHCSSQTQPPELWEAKVCHLHQSLLISNTCYSSLNGPIQRVRWWRRPGVGAEEESLLCTGRWGRWLSWGVELSLGWAAPLSQPHWNPAVSQTSHVHFCLITFALVFPLCELLGVGFCTVASFYLSGLGIPCLLRKPSLTSQFNHLPHLQAPSSHLLYFFPALITKCIYLAYGLIYLFSICSPRFWPIREGSCLLLPLNPELSSVGPMLGMLYRSWLDKTLQHSICRGLLVSIGPGDWTQEDLFLSLEVGAAIGQVGNIRPGSIMFFLYQGRLWAQC